VDFAREERLLINREEDFFSDDTSLLLAVPVPVPVDVADGETDRRRVLETPSSARELVWPITLLLVPVVVHDSVVHEGRPSPPDTGTDDDDGTALLLGKIDLELRGVPKFRLLLLSPKNLDRGDLAVVTDRGVLVLVSVCESERPLRACDTGLLLRVKPFRMANM